MSSSIFYNVFVYLEQLRSSRNKGRRLQKAKLNLTKGLVKNSLKEITENCDLEGVQCLRRSIEYKIKLERKMRRNVRSSNSKN